MGKNKNTKSEKKTSKGLFTVLILVLIIGGGAFYAWQQGWHRDFSAKFEEFFSPDNNLLESSNESNETQVKTPTALEESEESKNDSDSVSNSDAIVQENVQPDQQDQADQQDQTDQTESPSLVSSVPYYDQSYSAPEPQNSQQSVVEEAESVNANYQDLQDRIDELELTIKNLPKNDSNSNIALYLIRLEYAMRDGINYEEEVDLLAELIEVPDILFDRPQQLASVNSFTRRLYNIAENSEKRVITPEIAEEEAGRNSYWLAVKKFFSSFIKVSYYGDRINGINRSDILKAADDPNRLESFAVDLEALELPEDSDLKVWLYDWKKREEKLGALNSLWFIEK